MFLAGDIDGAAQLLPVILSSDMPESSRHLVLLRQACADNRVGDALRIYERGVDKFADDASIMWIGRLIMGEENITNEVMMRFDEAGNMKGISDFLSYGTFDARPFPNLMALLREPGN